ncbi:MAG: hypothetical protein ACOC6D_06390 [Atribacterota bacterium]
MVNDWTKNPIIMVFKYIINIFVEHAILFISIFIVIIIIYFIHDVIIQGFEKISSVFRKWKIESYIWYISRKLTDKKTKKEKIKIDIYKHIETLRLNNPTVRLYDGDIFYTSLQYLLCYPSPDGFRAIMEIAFQADEKIMRDELICALCKSVKNNHNWYC